MQFKKWLKRSLILIPVVIGIATVVYAPKLKKPPQKTKVVELATKARIIKPLHQEVSPIAVGYGTSASTRSWEAVAEVPGRIVWVSENLKEGNILTKGTELLRIDHSDYKLALSQINAQLNTSKVKANTIRKTLAIERRSQNSLKKEVLRQKQLNRKGLLSSSTLESAERDLIKADASIQSLQNSLSINEAEREAFVVQRKHAELDLARTKIMAPFDVRIVTVNAHEARYASKGQLLFSADATDKTEIEARFPIGQLRHLIASKIKAMSKSGTRSDKHPGVLGLTARVRLRTATHNVEWNAKIERVAGQIDRQTQTLGVIVVVDDPYGKAKPGQRPPLIRNTFVEVELRGTPKGKQVIIPVSAIHEGKVYLMDEEERLYISKVKVAFTQGRYAVIAKGVMSEDKIVVSDLVPAIEGMLLDPIMDRKTRKMLMAEVLGPDVLEKMAQQKKDKNKKDKLEKSTEKNSDQKGIRQ